MKQKIIDLIELSYIISKDERFEKLDEKIKNNEYGAGEEQYANFIMFCYDKYINQKDYAYKIDFVDYELEKCIEEFENKEMM